MVRASIELKRIAGLVSHTTVAAEPKAWLPVRMPFTGEMLGEIAAGCEADVEFAVERARAAQPKWQAAGCGERARIFLRFHDLLLRRQDEVLDLIQLETGKARRHAFEEILDTAIISRYYARHGKRILRSRRRRGALPLLTRALEFRQPVGVCGFLVPWNYPLTLAITDAIAALMAGNTGVIKPDPQASLTALWALALLREAGLPRDVLHVITGDGALLGSTLSGRVDYIMFTGSGRTGRVVGRQAAERLVGCSLELGGKNPMLVLADADLDAAVDGAIRGCFCGAGQVCVSIERIYVHDSLFEPFLSRFAQRAQALKIGSGLDYSAEMGSLTNARQLQVVETQVADALAKGAVLVAGGRRRPDLGPLFYEPTILRSVRPEMELYAEETFGPVVSVYPFIGEAEAIEMANEGHYGLNASIWSRSTGKAVCLARRIRAGSVNINEAYAAAWGSVDSPSGGVRQSGLQPRHGAEGILKYTQSQTVAVQRLIPIAPFGRLDARRFSGVMTRLLRALKAVRVFG